MIALLVLSCERAPWPQTSRPVREAAETTTAARVLIVVNLDETYLSAPVSLPFGLIAMSITDAGREDHRFAIGGNGVDVDAGEVFKPGQMAKVVNFNLPPGRYVFYCPLPGHRARGEAAVVTVEP